MFLGIGNFLVVAAFRMAPIATVAPFRYTLMLWSAAAGFVVFGDLPDRWFFVGGALILGAGLYTLHRERVRARFPRFDRSRRKRRSLARLDCPAVSEYRQALCAPVRSRNRHRILSFQGHGVTT